MDQKSLHRRCVSVVMRKKAKKKRELKKKG